MTIFASDNFMLNLNPIRMKKETIFASDNFMLNLNPIRMKKEKSKCFKSREIIIIY